MATTTTRAPAKGKAKAPAKGPAAKKPATSATAGLQDLTIDKLVPSPLNPRKTFDPVAIDELAASIRADGQVYQNLVARKHPTKRGKFEIIAGERRYRSVSQLVKAGDWLKTKTVPVKVIVADDAKVIEIGALENMQRKNLTPLEEARAFAALRELGRETDQIAEAVGMSRRHVQVRLQLVDTLTPEAQMAMEQGALSLAQVRMIMLEKDAKAQNAIVGMALEDRARGGEFEPRSIRHHILHKCIHVSKAIFPPEQYKGEYVTDEDNEDIRYFKDRGQFEKLQQKAITELEKTLKEEWAWVEVHRGCRPGGYEKSKDKTVAGAFIVVSYDRSVEVSEGWAKEKPKRAIAGGGAKAETPVFTKAHLSYASHRKTEALQDAVAADPRTAKLLVCVALMGGSGTVRITGGRVDPVVSPRLAPSIADIISKLPDKIFGSEEGVPIAIKGQFGLHCYIDDAREANAYSALQTLSDEELDRLLAVLVATSVGTWTGWSPTLGDDPLPCAVAEDLQIDMTEHWQIDEAYLELCRKKALREIFEAVAPSGDDADMIASRDKMTAKAMRTAITMRNDSDTMASVYVLPREMQFGSEKELKKAKALKYEPPEDVAQAAE